ncbi:MAG TPA: DUF3352 domain-containing protein [Bacteroidia bacterium]|jgi:hypothetical protein|nr:DUF3352 domain-containing protein [Bacteroidia bacterium]
MLKKILLGLLIAGCIAAGIYWFTYMKEIKAPVSSGLNAIPLDAALVLESKQTVNAWTKLATSNLWQEFTGSATGNKLNLQIHYIDSLLRHAPAVAQLLVNQSVFISAHNSGPNSFDFLFVYSLPNLSHKSTVTDFIKSVNDNKEPSSRMYDDAEIKTIHPKNKDSLSFSFVNGILMASANQSLVEDAIRQLKSGISLSQDKNFSKVISTAGKNVDGNLYLNYKKFPELLNKFVATPLQEDTKDLPGFADYSGWDITIKPNALLFSGFTQANDSSNNFLSLFNKQDPQEIELTRIIPSKTALLFFMGISDIKAFHRKYKNYLSFKSRSQAYEVFISDINKKYKLNIERSFLDWISNEMALVVTEPNSATLNESSYAVFHASNIKEATATLNALTDSICKKNGEEKDTAQVGDYIITHINLDNLLPQLFGWQFRNITKNYFTSVDDYIVVANSADALKKFILDFEHNKTLEKDKNYRSFLENVSTEATLFTYASVPRLLSSVKTILNDELAADVDGQQERLQKFDKIGFQFSTNKGLFYSSACISFNSQYGHELKPEWETKMDTSFSRAPYIVNNYRTNAKDVFIQDDLNKLILINNEGKISWTRQIWKPIAGQIFQPVTPQKPRMQLLFNTTTHLYKLDENGRDAKGFPIKFKLAASNAINMITYEKDGEPRIFVAYEDKTVHCLNIFGDEITGFKPIKTDNAVTLPVQYFQVNGKDYICVIDQEGKIYVTDRKGEVRLKLKERFPKSIDRLFVDAGVDNEHTYLITSDTTGKVTRIRLDDSKEQFRPKHLDTPVNMTYADVNKDGKPEYIFQSPKELDVYNFEKQEVFHYTFKDPVLAQPLVLTLPDGNFKIGAVSPSSNKIYLFNANGAATANFPVRGKTYFEIGNLNNDDALYLITGTSENTLLTYPLE